MPKKYKNNNNNNNNMNQYNPVPNIIVNVNPTPIVYYPSNYHNPYYQQPIYPEQYQQQNNYSNNKKKKQKKIRSYKNTKNNSTCDTSSKVKTNDKLKKKLYFEKLKQNSIKNKENKDTNDKQFEVIGLNITPTKSLRTTGTSTDFIDNLLNDIFFVNNKKKENNIILKAPIDIENNFDLDKEYDKLPFQLNTLHDLIKLGKLYDKKKPHQYGINMKRLNFMIESIEKLLNIIGMEDIKKIIFNKIITYIQGLGKIDDMLNIVIQAPPGYGKTMLGYLLSEIFYKMGIIKKPEQDDKKFFHPITNQEIDFPFVIAKRKDLIGEYLGQTAPKVEKKVKEAEGGVLFIDEAYSLGTSNSRKESYSETCLNTLNQLLSEKAGRFICIIAGYKDELKKSFFINPGLERRFRLIFTIPQYKSSELVLIFNKMIIDDKWELADSILLNTKNNELLTFINKNKNNFKFCGGDMQALLQNCRDAHSTRVIGKHPKFKKKITMDDIYKGYDLFIKNMDRNNNHSNIQHMYS
jgi:SpoVK/Ycf46/Vps4 family AAA+-type ATPase